MSHGLSTTGGATGLALTGRSAAIAGAANAASAIVVESRIVRMWSPVLPTRQAPVRRVHPDRTVASRFSRPLVQTGHTSEKTTMKSNAYGALKCADCPFREQ